MRRLRDDDVVRLYEKSVESLEELSDTKSKIVSIELSVSHMLQKIASTEDKELVDKLLAELWEIGSAINDFVAVLAKTEKEARAEILVKHTPQHLDNLYELLKQVKSPEIKAKLLEVIIELEKLVRKQ